MENSQYWHHIKIESNDIPYGTDTMHKGNNYHLQPSNKPEPHNNSSPNPLGRYYVSTSVS